MVQNSKNTYSIGDAEKITGVSQRMLRAWEGKHIPFPERIVCGDRAYRRYSQFEISLQTYNCFLLASTTKQKLDAERQNSKEKLPRSNSS